MRGSLQSYESFHARRQLLEHGAAAESTAARAAQLHRLQTSIPRPFLGATHRAGIERSLQNPLDPTGNYQGTPLRNTPNFGSGFLALLAVTVVAIAGVMLVRLCFIRRLIMRRRQAGLGAEQPGQEGEQQQGPVQRKGLEPELLAFLPVQAYSPEQSDQELPPSVEPSSTAPAPDSERPAGPNIQDMRECPVCLTEYEPGEHIKFLPGCGHTFHGPCIVAWLGSKTTCPLCREEVGPALQELADAERAKKDEEQGVEAPAAALKDASEK